MPVKTVRFPAGCSTFNEKQEVVTLPLTICLMEIAAPVGGTCPFTQVAGLFQLPSAAVMYKAVDEPASVPLANILEA